MATIQNDRDALLQAASPRVVPVPIPISQVTGLTGALGDINTTLSTQNSQISSALNNTKDIIITASSTVFSGSSTGTTPSTITLTATLKNGLSGTVTWSVVAGSITITPSGNTCVLTGASMSSQSVTIRARLVSGNTYDAFVTVAGLGKLAAQNAVDLTSQVTGQLATGNITGLGALALLNTVNLNTQTTGALNGATQVTNLGTLAYANAIAANQIGAGTLAAGVIYAGTINATQVNAGSFTGKEFTGGTFTGSLFRTAASGRRIEIANPSTGPDAIALYNTTGSARIRFDANPFSGSYMYGESYANPTLHLRQSGGGGSDPSGALAPVLRLESVNGCAHIRANPVAGFPASPTPGDLVMHSTHGLCVYNGVAWVKFTVEAI